MNLVTVVLRYLSVGFFVFATSAFAVCYQDPLIIDLGGDGLQLGAKGRTVIFDLAATGQGIEMQWVAPNGNEAFLAIDRNDNGIVDDGSELFTNYGYLILDGEMAANGFVELAQYDIPALGGNNDGQISASDEIWSSLSLWLDSNADGVSTADEMLSLTSVGLTRLQVIAKDSNERVDAAGNLIPLWSWVYGDKGGQKLKMYDVFFAEPVG